MLRSLRDKWLVALRSGEFKQIQQRLRIGNSYCCMGVLCEVSGKGDWFSLSSRYNNDRTKQFIYKGDVNLHYPPKEFGLLEKHVEYLGEMNDMQGKSFPEIADWIEKYVPIEEDPVQN